MERITVREARYFTGRSPTWYACEQPERPVTGESGGAWHVIPYCRACDISIQAHVANNPDSPALLDVAEHIARARG